MLSINTWSIFDLIANASRLRLSLDQHAADENGTMLNQYRDWVRLVSRLIAGLRLSPRWAEQDTADQLEIWLLSELIQPLTIQ